MAIASVSSFSEQMKVLKADQARLVEFAYGRKLNVVILGGGISGLIRAIESIMAGHITMLLEKRAEDAAGLLNTVAIKSETYPLLKQYGIYQWLMEQGLVSCLDSVSGESYFSVRLKDLVRAMKAVLQELSPNEQIIRYECVVKEINRDNAKAKIVFQNENQELESIHQIDVINNSEGAHSTSNALVGIDRVEYLSKIPVVAAIFKDNRARVTGICTLVSYIAKTIAQCAVSVYYYAIFFFRFIFMGERLCNPDRNIVGMVVLKTPGQNYLGYGMNGEYSDKLIDYQKRIEEKKRDLAANPENERKLTKELANLERDLQSFVKFWANMAFCAANFYKFIAKIFCCQIGYHTQSASRLPFSRAQVFDIGADHARIYAKKLQQTAFLVSGDAMATVDPTTGLGANTAIQTSTYFKSFLREAKCNYFNLNQALTEYQRSSMDKVDEIHQMSLAMRRGYRPDAAQTHSSLAYGYNGQFIHDLQLNS